MAKEWACFASFIPGRKCIFLRDLVENARVVLEALSSDMLSVKRKILSVGVQSTDSIMLPVWAAEASKPVAEEKSGKKGVKRVRFEVAEEEEEEEGEDVGKMKLSEVPVGKLEEVGIEPGI